jgi:hypothetical protein
MIEVDKKISDYCKELNIKSPFWNELTKS